MKRKTQITFATILLAGAAFAASVDTAAARGREGPGGFQPVDFATLDADNNGSVTMEELLAHMDARFVAADSDSNGTLDKGEMTQMITDGMVERMAAAQSSGRTMRAGREMPDAERLAWMADGMRMRMDADDDGLVSAEEMRPAADQITKMFARMDADSDGAITQAEFDAAKSNRGGQGGRRGGGQSGHHGGHNGGHNGGRP